MAQRVGQLRQRAGHLTGLCERANEAIKRQKALRGAGVDASLPKTQIKPRIAGLKTLETKIATNIELIFDRDSFNLVGLNEALEAAHTGLLETWRRCVAPPRASLALDGVEDPEVEVLIRRIKEARNNLQKLAETLPEKSAEAKQGIADREAVEVLIQKLTEAGLDPEVLDFLEKARTEKGISLADVLGNTKVMRWLGKGTHAGRFTVSVYNRTAYYKR
jgi:hypothetical protein